MRSIGQSGWYFVEFPHARELWIPAFAGMTGSGGWIPAFAGIAGSGGWIPACSGMTRYYRGGREQQPGLIGTALITTLTAAGSGRFFFTPCTNPPEWFTLHCTVAGRLWLVLVMLSRYAFNRGLLARAFRPAVRGTAVVQ